MSDKIKEFQNQVKENITKLGCDKDLHGLSNIWIRETSRCSYTYNFSWMGRPIIQFPQDVFALQEIIWSVQPDLIIETGIAHGGSLIFHASMLELNAACGGASDAEVLGIDIDIRAHNREAMEAHPMFKRITMLEGSSIDPGIIEQVRTKAAGKERVLVILDSNHTYEHVKSELKAYASLVTIGSYCIVFDTSIEDLPEDMLPENRPWDKENNPKTAVHEFLESSDRFEIDKDIQHKLLITVAPDGYLKRVH